jgi:hypothetical protein
MINQSTGISPCGSARAGTESCAPAVETRTNKQVVAMEMRRSSFMVALIGQTLSPVAGGSPDPSTHPTEGLSRNPTQ